MDQTLINEEKEEGSCLLNCSVAIKIFLLVALTYGLMALMFFLWYSSK